MALRTEKLATGVLHALSGKRNAVAPKNWDDAEWRGRIDARAMRERYSDPRIHAELIALAGSNGQQFEQLEQARVEARVPQIWRGVRANLGQLRQGHPLPDLPEQLSDLVSDQRAFGLAALRLIGAAPVPVPVPVAKPTTTQNPTTHMDALRSARDVPRGTIVGRRSTAPAGARAYHVFTEQFDTQADANSLCSPSARDTLAEQLRRFRRDSTADIARWARRLQRHLQVQ